MARTLGKVNSSGAPRKSASAAKKQDNTLKASKKGSSLPAKKKESGKHKKKIQADAVSLPDPDVDADIVDNDDTAAAQPVAAKKQRKYRFKPGTQRRREIRKRQNKTELVMQRAPFRQTMRELCQTHTPDMRFSASSFEALQEICESVMHGFLTDAVTLMNIRKSATTMPRDFRTAVRLAERHSNFDTLTRDLTRNIPAEVQRAPKKKV